MVSTAVLALSDQVRAADLMLSRGGDTLPRTSSETNLEVIEREIIFKVLERTGGHHQKAAELLGISARTLSRKLKSYGTAQSK
jgi:DNA-binding NtrC family response regulator